MAEAEVRGALRVPFDMLYAGLGDKRACAPWDGQTLGLPDAALVPVVVWRFMMTRWAATVDAAASEAALGELVAFLAASLAPLDAPPTSPAACLGALSRLALRNAEFLELPRVRAAVLQYAVRAAGSTETTLAAVRILAAVPTEYCTRASAQELLPQLWCVEDKLVRGAVPLADVAAWAQLQSVVSRLAAAYPGAAPGATFCAQHYLDALARLDVGAHDVDALLQSSAELLTTLLKRDARATTAPVLTPAGPWPCAQRMTLHAHTIVWEFAAQARPAWTASLPLPTLDALAAELNAALASVRRAADGDASVALQLRLYAAQIQLAPPAASLSASHVGAQIREAVATLCAAHAAGSMSTDAAASLAAGLLACLVALGHRVAPEVVALLFAALHAALPTAANMDSIFVRLVVAMDADRYDQMLSTIEATLERALRDDGARLLFTDLAALLHVAALLLQHAPLGASRTAGRRFSSLVLRLTPLVVQMPALTAPAVALVERMCLHQARLLRAVDAPRILALVGVALGPRTVCESVEADASAIFGGLCNTLRALVRQRKDLIRPLLPHITELLSLLLPMLSSLLRANAGQAQRRRVYAATPRWIDVLRAPLGVSDARALSRLLTELAAKTAVATGPLTKRRRTEPAGATESLAKPMSKHAVYMLVAYVRCVTQPATTIAVPLRRELEPGLFALCDMCGDFERDAALKGMLDASGQVVFKALWTEWEHQRYKGA